MKSLKAIISLIMLISLFIVSGSSSESGPKESDFLGTWYGISGSLIIKTDIEKKDNGIYVTQTCGQYRYKGNSPDNYIFYWTGFGKYIEQRRSTAKVTIKENTLHFIGKGQDLDWKLNKNGELEGAIDFFYIGGGKTTGTLKKANKVKLEDLKKAIEKPSVDQRTFGDKPPFFTDEQPPKLEL